MNELKQAILEHAGSELRKEINKRKVEEMNVARKLREDEIAKKRKLDAAERGEDPDEVDVPDAGNSWSRGIGKVESMPEREPREERKRREPEEDIGF